MKIAQLAREMLMQKKGDVKRNTYESYLYTTTRIIEYCGEKEADEISYNDIQDMLNTLYTKGYCKSTIKKRRQSINDILELAEKKGIIERNPCKLVTIPRNAFVGERRNLTMQEVNILLHSRTCPSGEFALFLYYTGTRSSEAIPVKWADINFENNEIKISRVVSYSQGKTYIDNFLKNKDKFRIIPISQKLRELLISLPKKHEYIFTNMQGNIMARNTVRTNWKKFQESSGLTEVTPHMLRHTFATNLYRAGIDIKTIQKITGHHNLQLLFNRYIHDDLETVKKSVGLMDAFYQQQGTTG